MQAGGMVDELAAFQPSPLPSSEGESDHQVTRQLHCPFPASLLQLTSELTCKGRASAATDASG